MIGCLLFSLAIHATVLAVVFNKPEEKKQEKKQDTQPAVVTVQIKEKGKGTIPCKDTYSGVGFMYNAFTQMIVEAPPTYPAYKAGIRVGDYLLEPGKPRERTGPAIIRVKRDGKLLTFKIPQEEICVDGRN